VAQMREAGVDPQIVEQAESVLRNGGAQASL
jgi:hypothetical protein